MKSSFQKSEIENNEELFENLLMENRFAKSVKVPSLSSSLPLGHVNSFPQVQVHQSFYT